ncbi:MAG: flagellar hook protein FlgE [Actinomycetaceae bacterium]|nr:flagellar hook protein FlgE [Actinomycetaceae bacterium]
MLRSLFTGISGLSVHQTMLDVTGNNIANVNTTGYKSASTRFEDTLSQMVKAGGSPDPGVRGGMNPSQVGLGVKLQSITNNFTNGAAQMTGRNLDVMVNGDGFFVLRQSNGTQVYTRNGSFGLDSQGQVVAADGSFVQGWPADKKGVVNASGQPSNLTVPLTQTMDAAATKKITYGGNLPADQIWADKAGGEPKAYTQAMKVFDDKGNPHNVLVKYTRENPKDTGPGSSWRVQLFDAEAYAALGDGKKEAAQLAFSMADKAEDGTAITITDYLKGGDTDTVADVFNLNDDGTVGTTARPNPKDLVISFNSQGQLSDNAKKALKTLKFQIANFSEVKPKTDGGKTTYGVNSDPSITAETTSFDLSGLTGFGGLSNFAVNTLDGNSAGTLTGFSVQSDGMMRGTFSNGDTRNIGKVAMASFSNPMGLEKAGSSYFIESGNSGQPQIGEPGTGSRGSMTGGAIEMSNVDLSQEFTNLILAQRGFQANSRVITTSDEILQELVNMKR